MKKFFLVLICLLSLFGCSASASDSLPDEDVAEVQAALGTCPRPTGDAGDQTAPFESYVTSVHVNSVAGHLISSQLKIGSTNVTTGVTTYGIIDFGYNQAWISGTGWDGTRLTSVTKYDPTSVFCQTGDPNLKCMVFVGPSTSGRLYYDKSYSAPVFAGTAFTGAGVTKIRGYGPWDPQTLKFYYDNAGAVGTYSMLFEGPMLDACANPG